MKLLIRVGGSPAAWTCVALVTALLLGQGEGASRFGWLLPVLFACYLGLWAATRSGRRLPLPHRLAAPLYLLVGGAGAVVYELSLSSGPGGLGGLHPDTGTSFALLPGFAVPALVGTLWLVRRHGLDERDLFFVSGALGVWEAVTVGGPAMVAAPLLAPLLIAFYVASYAVYCGAPGLLVVRPAELWSAHPGRPAWPVKLALGAAVGAVSWLVFGLWGLVLGV